MSYGYSSRIVSLNKAADKRRLGVAFGRAAIELGISVTDIANTLEVSRQTVYNWFTGSYDPQAHHAEKIDKMLQWFRQELK